MNLYREMRTDGQLWLIFGAAVFVAFGFVVPVDSKGGESSVWLSLWRDPFTLNGIGPGLVFLTLVLGVPALVLGWVAQAVVVAIRSPIADVQPIRRAPAGCPACVPPEDAALERVAENPHQNRCLCRCPACGQLWSGQTYSPQYWWPVAPEDAVRAFPSATRTGPAESAASI